MNPVEPAIRVYPDILEAREFVYSWLPEFTFRPTRLDQWKRERLREVVGIEAHFSSPVTYVTGFVRDFVLADDQPCFLFAAEYESSTKSRVRSYKGLFRRSGSIVSGQYVQAELELGGNYTHLVGIAAVTRQNFLECAGWFADSQRSFIISSPQEARLSEDFAAWVLKLASNLPGLARVDYAELVQELCPSGDRIYRMGGYSGDGDADFQIFVRRPDMEAIVERLKQQALLASVENENADAE